jgi:hypothetical protein
MSLPVYQHKRGNVNNLPLEGLSGEIFVTEDTGELYGGQGSSKPLLRFSPKRYTVGPKSYVLATGFGVTLEKTDNVCAFNVPTGVEILSASIHFEASEIGNNTNCLIDFGVSAGCGHNGDYDTLFVPQFQVWADVANSRAFKTGVAGNLNSAANVLEITALDEQQAIWINLSF